jgi:cell division protein FtsI (penicillin-binding protein 3)
MITLDKDKEISDRKIMFEMNKMPELTNLSAREVIRVFNDTDIELEIVGRGMVYKQEPDFGSEMSKVKKVKVYLEE